MESGKEVKTFWYWAELFLKCLVVFIHLFLNLCVLFSFKKYDFGFNIPFDVSLVIYFLSSFIFIPYFIFKQLFNIKDLKFNFFSTIFYLINNAMLLIIPLVILCFCLFFVRATGAFAYNTIEDPSFESEILSVALFIFVHILFLVSNFLLKKLQLVHTTTKKILLLFIHLIIFGIFLCCSCFSACIYFLIAGLVEM